MLSLGEIIASPLFLKREVARVNVLVIDIGGTHIKVLATGENSHESFRPDRS
jgi:hexokinase